MSRTRRLHWKRRHRPLDAWSVPHFLFGSVMALGAEAFRLPLISLWWVTLTLAVLWEFFEMKVKLRETFWNVVTDITLPLIAFVFTVLLVDRAKVDEEHRLALFVVVCLVYFFTNLMAWKARLDRDSAFLG